MINPTEIHPTRSSPRRYLPELLPLSVLLLTLMLLGQWLWLSSALETPAVSLSLPAERTPLLDSLLRQKTIVWSLSLSAVSMIMAIIITVSPLAWWLYLRAVLGKRSELRLAHTSAWGPTPQNAEEWVAAQAALLQMEGVQSVLVGQAGAETTAPNQAVAAPMPIQSQPLPQQDPSAIQQPGAQPQAPQIAMAPPGAQTPVAPGEQPPPAHPGTQPPQPQPQPQSAQSGYQQPGTPQPLQPQQALQQLLAPGEDVDLNGLTDIGDILSSFTDNEDVSPYLLALSQSLSEIDMATLVARCRRVTDQLAMGISPKIG